MPTLQCILLARDSKEYFRELSGISGQNNWRIPTVATTNWEAFANQVLCNIERIDDNVCWVEYLDFNQELLNIRSLVNRGGLQNLAESIIGNGLAIGSHYIIVLRNRKAGIGQPKFQDRQLIKYLMFGLNNLETTLLDYIINRRGNIFSAKEAGMLKGKSKAN